MNKIMLYSNCDYCTFVGVLVNVLGVLPGLGDATVVPWVSSLGVNIGDVSEVALR